MESSSKTSENKLPDDTQLSCTPGLTRKQFMERILTRAGAAGTLIVAASLIEMFQPLPAVAEASEGT